MKQFEVTLVALSEKKLTLSAESPDEALEKAQHIYFTTDALDFSDEDVVVVEASSEPVIALD